MAHGRAVSELCRRLGSCPPGWRDAAAGRLPRGRMVFCPPAQQAATPRRGRTAQAVAAPAAPARPRREDVITSDPANNVSDHIYEKLGANLHLRPDHPIFLIKKVCANSGAQVRPELARSKACVAWVEVGTRVSTQHSMHSVGVGQVEAQVRAESAHSTACAARVKAGSHVGPQPAQRRACRSLLLWCAGSHVT